MFIRTKTHVFLSESRYIKEYMISHKTPLKTVLHDLYHGSDDETQLLSSLSAEVDSLQLTFAEQALLVEGSQLGVADCTIPPYVEYEAILDDGASLMNIRSELAEWVLSPNVSEILFSTGFLEVIGADFVPIGDMSMKLAENIPVIKNGERFSLDLSSRNLSVDLAFERCDFYSGINISNSTLKSLSFHESRFGSTNEFSLLGNGTTLKGSFEIQKHKKDLNFKDQDKDVLLNGSIKMMYSTFENQLNIVGQDDWRIYKKGVTIEGDLDLYGIVAKFINIQFINIKDLNLTFAKFETLFLRYGNVNEINAAGIECNGFCIRDSCYISSGIKLYKARINGDFECVNSVIAPIEEEKEASLYLRSSKIRNLVLNDGFILMDGKIDLQSCEVENAVTFSNSFIYGKKQGPKRVAINAKNCRFNGVVNFSVDQNEKDESSPPLNPFCEKAYSVYKDRAKMFFSEYEGQTRIFGEINFEHAIVEKSLDCAGLVIKDSGERRTLLNLRFVEVKNSLFLNSGSLKNKAPFVVEGYTDLRNARINGLFISVPSKDDKNRHDKRLRLIGAKYNYIDDDSTNSRRFYDGKWIYKHPLKTKNKSKNFRQPFEQFAAVLLQMGEDSRARDVLMLRRPSLNFVEWAIMFLVIRPLYTIGSRVYWSVILLVSFFIMGSMLFDIMHSCKYLGENNSNIHFNSYVYSFQQLIPLINLIAPNNYYLSGQTPIIYEIYYYAHTIIGLLLIPMLLVGVARIRKGGS